MLVARKTSPASRWPFLNWNGCVRATGAPLTASDHRQWRHRRRPWWWWRHRRPRWPTITVGSRRPSPPARLAPPSRKRRREGAGVDVVAPKSACAALAFVDDACYLMIFVDDRLNVVVLGNLYFVFNQMTEKSSWQDGWVFIFL